MEALFVFLASPIGLPVTLNTRGPFGIGPQWAVVLVSALVVLILILDLMITSSASTSVSSLAAGVLLGGGVANLIERLLWGATTDVVIGAGLAANLADVAVTGGLVLIVSQTLAGKKIPRSALRAH